MINRSLLTIILAVAFACSGHTGIAQGPFTIGTIHPGDSILVIYDVSINAGATGTIVNQGTVSGSNFSNSLTDDPDMNPGTTDPTITLLNMFPLPAVFGDFKAYQKNTDIELAWKILTEYNTLRYEIEKSPDGRTFSKIGEVPARGGNAVNNYLLLDVSPFTGNNYYRLRIVDNDGTFKFSTIVRVVIGGSELVHFYPNPVPGKTVNVELRQSARGNYELTFYSISGQKIFSTKLAHNGGSASYVVHLPSVINNGLYHVQLTGTGKPVNHTLIIN